MARAKKRTSEPHPEPDVEGQGTAALPVRAKDDESAPKLPSGKGNITVFGDSDDEAVPAAPQPAAAKPPKVEESEEEDSSDDDEAPEAVSTQAAASVAKKSSQTAQRAAQEQATAQKRRRQERDALFKQQAEGRRKAKEDAGTDAEPSAPEANSDGEQVSALARRKMEGRRAPNLLPAEFLTDSSSEDEDDDDQGKLSARSKRRKVAGVEKQLTRASRGPRDEVVGSTLYRVAKKTDDRLAPKSSRHTQSSKDLLRRRNRTAVAARGGFFKR